MVNVNGAIYFLQLIVNLLGFVPHPNLRNLPEIFSQLHVKSRLREKYRAFVELGVDEEIAQFYSKGNIKPYLGSDTFRDWVYTQRVADDTTALKCDIQSFRPYISSTKLSEIAFSFNLKRSESIPTTIAKLKVLMEEDLKLKKAVDKVKREYYTSSPYLAIG